MLWARNTVAPSRVKTAVAARVPSSRSSKLARPGLRRRSPYWTGRPQHRPAGCGQLGQPAGGFQGVRGVLPEVVARVDHDPVAGHPPGRPRPFGQSVVTGRRCRPPRRGRPTRCGRVRGVTPPDVGAHQPGPELGGDLSQLRVQWPPHASLSTSAPAAQRRAPTHLVPPGVDADDHGRKLGPDPLDERDDPAGSPPSPSTSAPGLAGHAADVERGPRPRRRSACTRVQGGVFVPGHARSVERVGGAVDDRHHQRALRRELPAAQPQRARRAPRPGFAPSRGDVVHDG